jgi:hypothetical protein
MAKPKKSKKHLPDDQKRPESSDEDPELGDENDPEYREQLFYTFKYSDTKPEDIVTDPEMAKEYAEWLKTH